MKNTNKSKTGLHIDNSKKEVKVYTVAEFEQLRKEYWLKKFLSTLNIKFQRWM